MRLQADHAMTRLKSIVTNALWWAELCPTEEELLRPAKIAGKSLKFIERGRQEKVVANIPGNFVLVRVCGSFGVRKVPIQPHEKRLGTGPYLVMGTLSCTFLTILMPAKNGRAEFVQGMREAISKNIGMSWSKNLGENCIPGKTSITKMGTEQIMTVAILSYGSKLNHLVFAWITWLRDIQKKFSSFVSAFPNSNHNCIYLSPNLPRVLPWAGIGCSWRNLCFQS